MATIISTDQENPINTQPARKPGEVSRRPLHDILKHDGPKVEPKMQEKTQELEFMLVDFDICSGRHIKDDYKDIMCPSEQIKLYNASLFRSQTPPPSVEIDFDFDLF